ncbi:MAG: tRNA pseudouridine(55) synthase TruB [Betaproteobacteria bacterium]|nr:tRNA pseudouridine(55) synthase TruB [Betaproteobacteria bacterium]
MTVERDEACVATGALLVDKPLGRTSNSVLQEAKRLFRARKAGHAGTLDPLATGLLVVLFGEATKFASFLLDEDKEYAATVKLGERTSTGDAEGEVLEKKPAPSRLAEVLPDVLARFQGQIEQVPPMYSALKKDGIPLYERARRGETVDRRSRKVWIHELRVEALEEPFIRLRIRCSKGTYIRTLAEDLGAALGSAAHLSSLRRTASGRFRVEEAMTLAALAALPDAARAARILSLPDLLAGLPRAELDAGSAARFRNGQAVPCGTRGDICAVYGADGMVIGLGRSHGDGSLRPLRLTAQSQAAEKPRKTL